MKEYNRARVYLDENYRSQEHFTVSASAPGSACQSGPSRSVAALHHSILPSACMEMLQPCCSLWGVPLTQQIYGGGAQCRRHLCCFLKLPLVGCSSVGTDKAQVAAGRWTAKDGGQGPGVWEMEGGLGFWGLQVRS